MDWKSMTGTYTFPAQPATEAEIRTLRRTLIAKQLRTYRRLLRMLKHGWHEDGEPRRDRDGG